MGHKSHKKEKKAKHDAKQKRKQAEREAKIKDKQEAKREQQRQRHREHCVRCGGEPKEVRDVAHAKSRKAPETLERAHQRSHTSFSVVLPETIGKPDEEHRRCKHRSRSHRHGDEERDGARGLVPAVPRRVSIAVIVPGQEHQHGQRLPGSSLGFLVAADPHVLNAGAADMPPSPHRMGLRFARDDGDDDDAAVAVLGLHGCHADCAYDAHVDTFLEAPDVHAHTHGADHRRPHRNHHRASHLPVVHARTARHA